MVRFAILATLAIAIPAFAMPSPLQPDPAGDKNVGNGAHTQFIGGQCCSNNDCASNCCAGLTGQAIGLCSGVGAQRDAGKTGCGFVAPPQGASNSTCAAK
ncbi:hypothetical protein F5Y05DRAFT_417739 [Hypoxylon sp. FL0543]|nr:hypothetical protein F5Y05DRAFT_417739 [Hypoxylon sp. FL0543]